MTLSGWFEGTPGTPYIDAKVGLPALGRTRTIPFLLDTGSDTTVLMANDAARMGIDFRNVTPSSRLGSGVGGSIRLHQVSASITFSDAENLYVYRTTLAVAEPGEHNRGLPSLLGRDILNRWRLRYDAPADALYSGPPARECAARPACLCTDR